MKRILVVEDNANLAYGLQNNLEIEGYQVTVAEDGQQGLREAAKDIFDLIVLDLMLPKLDGFRLLKALREKGVDTPVLILSARGEELDKVQGFRLGADDYVTKPFSVLELLARIEALLRRAEPRGSGEQDATVRFGEIEVNPDTREVHRRGRLVELAPKEFDLLWALLQRRGSVASRLELIQEVWGYPDTVLTRTVDTHIGELRRKLEEKPSSPRHILTVRKAGYRLKRGGGR
ncbi:MAG TPA: response regulator transcription factor [Acidobacteriota bacterium]|nr:response regulator transcription factor [Acidobacteriota bacterium]